MKYPLKFAICMITYLLLISLGLHTAYSADCDDSLPYRSVSQVVYSPDSKTVLINRSGGLFAETWPVDGNQPSHLYHFTTVAAYPGGEPGIGENYIFSPDGKNILSKSSGQLWDGLTGAPLPRFVNPVEELYGANAAFSVDGSTIVTTGIFGDVTLWDAKTGRVLHQLRKGAACPGAAPGSYCAGKAVFSPDGKQILVNGIELWDLQSNTLLHTFDERELFSRDGQYLFSSDPHSVRIRDAHTFTLLLTFSNPSATFSVFGLSPDNSHIITYSRNIEDRVDRYQLWELQTGKLLQTLDYHDTSTISPMFGPDGNTFLMANPEGEIKLFSAKTGKFIALLTDNCDFKNHQVCPYLFNSPTVLYSPDGGSVLTSNATADEAQLWDAQSGRLLHSFTGLGGRITGATFSPDGQRIGILASDQGSKISLWGTITGGLILSPLQSEAAGVAFSPDGKRFLTGYNDGALQLWDSQSGAMLSVPSSHNASPASVWFSPDAKFIGAIHGEKVAIWDAQTGIISRVLPVTGARMFSPDWKYLVSVDRGSTGDALKIWDTESGSLLHTLDTCGCGITDLRFSSDNQMLAAATGREVRIWDVQSGNLLHTISAQTDAAPDGAFVLISNDGKYVGALDRNHTVRIWDAVSGRQLSTITSAVNFSLTDNDVLTNSADATVRLWDIQTGALRRTLADAIPTSYETRLQISPDGKFLFSNVGDGTIKLWDLQTGVLRYTLTTGLNQTDAVFAPDSETIVTFAGIPDGNSPKAQLWDLQTGNLIQTFCPAA